MSIYTDLTLVLVSYKSREKIKKLIKNISPNIKIVIIDNSEDKKIINDFKYSKNIEVFLKKNIGYGAAVNFAKSKIQTKYFLLCNPDLENLDDNKIISFYEIGNKLYPNFLALGPNFELTNSTIKNSYEIKSKISGSCMFFNSYNFDNLGGFDENFFLYFEEDDLCKRGNKKKMFSYKINNIYINHNIGTSVSFENEIQLKKLKELTLWHFIWSKFYFYKKHYGKLISIIIFFPTILRTLFKIFYTTIINNKEKNRKYKVRLSGLLSSITGKKSFKRI
ncbi:glycosyltransferase group 2 [alpha proteobacterium HIMB5]|nr:glycosyltransferase group 2 [alpha proteobacterium HIMB5]